MKIIADTNVLVRAVVQDDEAQTRVAIASLKSAGTIVITTTVFCEFVWVLRRYQFDRKSIAQAVASLMRIENVIIDRPRVEAGQQAHEAGGDFADGVIASEGAWLGGEMFISFDKKATTLLAEQGHQVQLLSG